MFLSIVIPVYNTPIAFLSECIESLDHIPLSIAYEVIIVNDESTNEDTLNYLSNLDKKKYHIIYKKNGGPGSARNVGIKKAKGEYIFPLDADDILNGDFSLFVTYLKENDSVDVLYGDLLYFGDVNKVEKNHEFNKIALWFENNIVPMCSFVRRSLWEKVEGFDENLKTFEDYDFWIQCAVKGGEFKYLPMSTYKYRVIDDGASRYQNTRELHKKYFKIIRDRVPVKEITFLGLIKFMKGYYLKKRKKKDSFFTKVINYVRTFLKTIEILKRISLSLFRRV
ncbi:glycosyltransferase [Tenacibaculum soleae]|uniref:Glycosyltransferase 2-like domain-containing protein n=1 Tax=Tenacibaculum soleae TaxID=447689 RepID=A0A1B9XXL2_9FLAO|nr:glycosyltransferase [Tenacibaculum soleae]MDO6812433.1 glycosyltransferase [Tenacibaculum soleae]OCK42293.1 hypothetical protein BA195_11760 [Tenacibaculum soleae]